MTAAGTSLNYCFSNKRCNFNQATVILRRIANAEPLCVALEPQTLKNSKAYGENQDNRDNS